MSERPLLFEGSEELFAGLYIHDRHDWSQRHPVVRLSFGGGNFRESDLLDANVMEQRDGVRGGRRLTRRPA